MTREGLHHNSHFEESLLHQSTNILRRRKAIRRLTRLGQKSQKLFRLADSGELPPSEHNKVVDELEKIQREFLLVAEQHAIDPRTLKLLEEDDPFAGILPSFSTRPTTKPPIENSEAVVVSFSDTPSRFRSRTEIGRFEDLSQDTLEAMMTEQAGLLAGKIRSQRVYGEQGGAPIRQEQEAENVAMRLRNEIISEPDKAISGAIFPGANRDHIRELLG